MSHSNEPRLDQCDWKTYYPPSEGEVYHKRQYCFLKAVTWFQGSDGKVHRWCAHHAEIGIWTPEVKILSSLEEAQVAEVTDS